jgi:hypothetical protein
MSEQDNAQTGHDGFGVSDHDLWKRRFGLIGIIIVALLLLPPLPPWLRVIATALAAWAVLEAFDVLPRLQAKWQGLISALPSDPERDARWIRALALINLLALAFFLLPPLPPRFRVIAFAIAALILLLGALGAFPRLRTTCQRWLAALGIT